MSLLLLVILLVILFEVGFSGYRRTRTHPSGWGGVSVHAVVVVLVIILIVLFLAGAFR